MALCEPPKGAGPRTPRGYNTARTRRQWEPQRGNSALQPSHTTAGKTAAWPPAGTAVRTAALRPRRFALGRPGLHGDFGGLGQQTRIFVTEYGAAKSDRGLDLRLPKRAVSVAGVA